MILHKFKINLQDTKKPVLIRSGLGVFLLNYWFLSNAEVEFRTTSSGS